MTQGQAVGGTERDVADRLLFGRAVHVHDAAGNDRDAALGNSLPFVAGQPQEAVPLYDVEHLFARVLVRARVCARVEEDGEQLELLRSAFLGNVLDAYPAGEVAGLGRRTGFRRVDPLDLDHRPGRPRLPRPVAAPIFDCASAVLKKLL